MIIINKVKIVTETIELDKFLKWAGILPTGGIAKQIIRFGDVMVNGQVETRRSRQLVAGDEVEFDGENFIVTREPEPK